MIDTIEKRWSDYYDLYKDTSNYKIDKEMLDDLVDKLNELVETVNELDAVLRKMDFNLFG